MNRISARTASPLSALYLLFLGVATIGAQGGRVLMADSPAAGANNTWPYGSCYFLVQDMDIVIDKGFENAPGANIDNKPSAGPEDCFMQCKQNLTAWGDSKKSDIQKVRQDNSQEKTIKALQLLQTMTTTCRMWTFVPGSSESENGTCYLKNGINYALVQGSIDLAKASTEAAYNSFASKYGEQKTLVYDFKPVTKAKGWFSGFMFAELDNYLGRAFPSQGQEDFTYIIARYFTIVLKAPNTDGLGCTKARADTYYCEKTLNVFD